MKKLQDLFVKVGKYIPYLFLIILLIGVGLKLYRGSEDKDIDTVSFSDEEVEAAEDIEQKCSVYVDVGGAVAKPGVYCLRIGERIITAIQKAGGFLKNSYASKYVARYLNLALPLKEDQKIYIPYQNDLSCNLIPFELRAEEEKEVLGKINEGEKKEDLEEKEEENKCVSINTASARLLMTVSGIGESMAQKIIDGRPYKEIEDLKNISGVGEATFEKFKPFICL
jgi:competence protein ComEA